MYHTTLSFPSWAASAERIRERSSPVDDEASALGGSRFPREGGEGALLGGLLGAGREVRRDVRDRERALQAVLIGGGGEPDRQPDVHGGGRADGARPRRDPARGGQGDAGPIPRRDEDGDRQREHRVHVEEGVERSDDRAEEPGDVVGILVEDVVDVREEALERELIPGEEQEVDAAGGEPDSAQERPAPQTPENRRERDPHGELLAEDEREGERRSERREPGGARVEQDRRVRDPQGERVDEVQRREGDRRHEPGRRLAAGASPAAATRRSRRHHRHAALLARSSPRRY
jgi:hypothetical protein